MVVIRKNSTDKKVKIPQWWKELPPNYVSKHLGRWIDIMFCFLQEGSYSLVGFCLSEVPVSKLLQETKVCRMGQPRKIEVEWTHSSFIDGLKVYQENQKMLKDVKETILQASHGTGACYGVTKCAEIIF